MGAGDFNISIKLDAGVTGAQDVKNITLNIGQLFAGAVEGNEKTAEAAKKAKDEMTKTQAAASALAKEFANTFKGDVTSGLKKGLEEADARVKKLTADLQAMYAAKAQGDPTGLVRTAIAQTEVKLANANKELQRFKDLSGSTKAANVPTPAAPGGGGLEGLGMGSLIGSLTLAGLATQAITAGFNAMKDALASVVSEGLKMNEFLETSKLGIATSIQAQYELRDAQGQILEGQDAYNAALKMSEEQMKQIRIAGLETAATSQELVKSFQTATAVAASQNITDLNKVRQLTVDVTNAATALGVSQAEVPTAIRGIITGREVEENTLARILVGSGEQVRQWQQQGVLLDKLNERLKPFSEGAKQAANSWAVVKSNIEESFQVFSGEVTGGLFDELKKSANEALSGIFDTKNLGISENFAEITDVVKTLFDGLGVVIGDSIKGAFVVLKAINDFLKENEATIEEWKQGFREIWVAVKEVFKVVFDLGKAIFGVRKETGELNLYFTYISLALKGVALLVAGIADGVRVIGGSLIWVAGLLIDLVLQPVRMWLNSMGESLNMVKKGWGDGLISIGAKIDGVGAKVRGFGADMFDPFVNGTSAVNKVMKSFQDTGKAAEDAGKKVGAAGDATIAKAKMPQKKTAGLGAQSAVAKAEAEAALAIAKDRLAREQKDLDYALSQQLISIKDYYAKKVSTQLEAVKAEEEAKRRELAAIQGTTAKTKDEELQKKASVIKLQGELNILKLKEGDIITENGRKEDEAKRALTNKVLEIRSSLEQAIGQQAPETIAATVAEKFRMVRQQFITEFGANSEQVGLVDNLINVETSKGKLAIIQKQYNDTLESMRLKEQEVQQQETAGTIGPIEAFQKIDDLHKSTAEQLRQLIPQMEAYAQAMNDPAMLNAVQKLKIELGEVAKAQSEVGKSLGQGLTNNLGNFFNDLASGAKSGSDAVKDFGRSVLATFAQIMSQQLALMAMKAMFGGTAAGGFMGFAGGGSVQGPGTSTSDSIPAMLSDGEYVVKASAVKRVGIGFLNMVNGITSHNGSHRYADGGAVTSSVGPAPQVNSSTKIVNVFDPSLLEDMMSTPKGEKAILNVIASNPQFMKAILA